MRDSLTTYLKSGYHTSVWYFGLFARLFKGKSTRSSILIIRNDALGDFVLSIGVLKFLREKYSNKSVVLLVERVAYEMALASGLADEVICFDKKRYRESVFFKMRFLLSLRRYRFETVINPVYARDRFSDEIALYTNAREIVGWNNPHAPNLPIGHKLRGDKIYTRLLDFTFAPSTHQLVANAKFIELLGGQSSAYPAMNSVEQRPMQAKREISVGIIMDAGNCQREWGTANFERLINWLSVDFPMVQVLLLGVRKDKLQIQQSYRPVIDKRSATTLAELINIVKQCSLVIGNETGPLHISALQGIETVCILGGGHYSEFFPYPAEYNTNNHVTCINNQMECYNCNWHCKYTVSNQEAFPCISSITVDRVFNEVSGRLRQLTQPPVDNACLFTS